MRKTRTVLVTTGILLGCMLMSGCGKYRNHYSTVAHAYTNTDTYAFVSFYKFTGVQVFTLKVDKDDTIHYTGEVEDGSVTVYIDTGDGKEELFTIESGEKVDEYTDELPKGTTYILVESDEQSENGNFEFEIE